jgi:hypothetical protein
MGVLGFVAAIFAVIVTGVFALSLFDKVKRINGREEK